MGSGFFLLLEHLGVSQILILQIYQGAPPQLSQLNRQYFAGIFHAFKAEIQNDDRGISLKANNPHMQCIQRSLHNSQVTDFLIIASEASFLVCSMHGFSISGRTSCRKCSKCFYVYLNIRQVRYSTMQL